MSRPIRDTFTPDPGFYRPSVPIRDWSERKMPDTFAMRKAAKVRVPCPKCGRMVCSNALGRHKALCNGPEGPKISLRGHDLCECGERKTVSVPTCSKCSWAGSDDAAILDALIAAGIDAPRGTL